jgi:formylglycine-generating enzyme required for sulfatase activity
MWEEQAVGYARRHALLIGIDEYESSAWADLHTAARGADAVARGLSAQFGFEQDRVRVLHNEEATREGIRRELIEWAADPAEVGQDDLVVIYFAGHGHTQELPLGESEGFLVPADASEIEGNKGLSSLLEMHEMQRVSRRIPAKHVLFLLDCCFSGLIRVRSMVSMAPGLSARARQVITAGSSQQLAWDSRGPGGHSPFTGALLDAFYLRKADEVLTHSQLFDHVYGVVEEITGGQMTPQNLQFRDHGGGSIALFHPNAKPSAPSLEEELRSIQNRATGERLVELERFEDLVRLRQLEEESKHLWPRRPKRAPDFDLWLSKAQDLLLKVPEHEATLAYAIQETRKRQQFEGVLPEGADRPDWRLATAGQIHRYDMSRSILKQMKDLEHRIADVKSRLEVAKSIRRISIDEQQQEWDEAISEVFLSDCYGGIEIEPRVGLVPIGPDPDSGFWEFWYVETGEQPLRDETSGKLVLTDETGMVLVLIPGGMFRMGAQRPTEASPVGEPNVDPECEYDEGPVHEVTLAPFFLSKYEMTQGQWLRIQGRNPSVHQPATDERTTLRHPVSEVSWEDCRVTLDKLGLEIPTEAQWEYACRAGTTTPWLTGERASSLQGFANLADRYARDNGRDKSWVYDQRINDGHIFPSSVASFQANAFGLHDIVGNVFEWTRDQYVSYADLLDPRGGDGLRGVEQQGDDRIARGGGYTYHTYFARSAKRVEFSANTPNQALGIRPSLSLD